MQWRTAEQTRPVHNSSSSRSARTGQPAATPIGQPRSRLSSTMQVERCLPGWRMASHAWRSSCRRSASTVSDNQAETCHSRSTSMYLCMFIMRQANSVYHLARLQGGIGHVHRHKCPIGNCGSTAGTFSCACHSLRKDGMQPVVLPRSSLTLCRRYEKRARRCTLWCLMQQSSSAHINCEPCLTSQADCTSTSSCACCYNVPASPRPYMP